MTIAPPLTKKEPIEQIVDTWLADKKSGIGEIAKQYVEAYTELRIAENKYLGGAGRSVYLRPAMTHGLRISSFTNHKDGGPPESTLRYEPEKGHRKTFGMLLTEKGKKLKKA